MGVFFVQLHVHERCSHILRITFCEDRAGEDLLVICKYYFMKQKRKIFISSLVTVAAVGALSVNMAQASYLGIKGAKRINPLPGVVAYTVGDVVQDAVVLHDTWDFEHDKNNYHHKTRRAAIKDAFESENWQLYHVASKGTYAAQVIDTPEKFAKLIEAQDLFQQSRFEEAREVAREVGIYDQKMWRKLIG